MSNSDCGLRSIRVTFLILLSCTSFLLLRLSCSLILSTSIIIIFSSIFIITGCCYSSFFMAFIVSISSLIHWFRLSFSNLTSVFISLWSLSISLTCMSCLLQIFWISIFIWKLILILLVWIMIILSVWIINLGLLWS